jgi:hypothetical protein
MFVTSDGRPYARFRRALERGNRTAALSAAREVEAIGLTDALELCLLLIPDGRRFERAILRWHARYVGERGDLGVEEAQAVLALLVALRGPRGPVAARALADLLDRRSERQAAELLIRWAGSPRGGR